MLSVIEGLLPDPVASGKETAPALVPEEDREHTTQVPHAIDPVFLVQMGDNLRVGSAHETVARVFEPGSQRREIIDLAVQHDRYRTILVVERLRAGDEVDDAQASVPEGRHAARGDILALAVRSSVGERVRHPTDRCDIDGPVRAKRHLPSDPAHGLLNSGRRSGRPPRR